VKSNRCLSRTSLSAGNPIRNFPTKIALRLPRNAPAMHPTDPHAASDDPRPVDPEAPTTDLEISKPHDGLDPEAPTADLPTSWMPPAVPGQPPWATRERPSDQQPVRIGPRGWTPLAWIVIVLATLLWFGIANILPMLPGASGPSPEDKVGPLLLEIQGKYFVGAGDMVSGPALEGPLQDLNVGTLDQRLRMVVLMGELLGRERAGEALTDLQMDIEAETAKGNVDADGHPTFEVTETQSSILIALEKLYVPLPSDADGIPAPRDVLMAQEIQLLEDELGWFGELAQVPEGAVAPSIRDDVIGNCKTVVGMLVAAVFGGLGLGGLGFIGLVILLVLAAIGTVKGRLGVGQAHSGIYAETFAVWLILFSVFNITSGKIADAMGLTTVQGMGVTLVGFLSSLMALAWPVMRGVPWSAVREDTGLYLFRRLPGNVAAGIGGYAMALPLLGMGVAMTFVFLLIQQALTPVGDDTFAPAGGPAHPIILELSGPDLMPKVMILLLASFAAPLVEETMFRGVFYRHLRDSTGRVGTFLSIVLSVAISSFIFAAVHPQGWVAIPALMSLAVAFCILREWRGSLLPSMIVHGISNGLVMSMLILLLSA
jgi:membrane protease YdiL (CAAX protease family)